MSGVIERAACETAFRDAVRACDPEQLVRSALQRNPVPKPIIGLAVGKAALPMARGLEGVSRGVIVSHRDDGRGVPAGWRLLVAEHPVPGPLSIEAGLAALALVESAGEHDTIVALISGGASALLEVPRPGVTIEDLRRHTLDAMARGAPIAELNQLRTELSAIKGGRLADRAMSEVVTLIVSDVVGDDPAVIGSGPTVRRGDRVEVIAPMAKFGEQLQRALQALGYMAKRDEVPLSSDVIDVADELAAGEGPRIAWGEPTLKLPAARGTGGRAQQLALELAKRLRGTNRSAFVAGTDGIDGNSCAAGAYVDGRTWDAIAETGHSPQDALDRRNATRALDAVGALFKTGSTGINHADVVVIS